MEKTDVIRLITEWQNLILRTGGIQREIEPKLLETMGSKPIKIITGFRRSGKSFLVQRIAKRLVDLEKITISNVLYLNFEDFRLNLVNDPKKLNEIFQMFKTDIAASGCKLLLLDEVQKVRSWDSFVRTIYEKEREVEIILTGSNSELLSAEIGSKLAGRFVEFHILPFSFQEYLAYHNLGVANKADFFRNFEAIQGYFSEYIKYGGLPEVLSIQNEDARFSYIEGILSKVILDDVIERFGIRHPAVVEKLLYYLLSAIGNTISFRKIMHYLNRLDITLKQETLINYIQYMLKTFAVFETTKFDWKIGKVFSTIRKYYAVDTGLANRFPPLVSNYSKQLENIVFLHLKRRGRSITFGALSSGKEIDFISMDRGKIIEKIQVTQSLRDGNRDRELAPLTLSDEYLRTGTNLLLSLDTEDSRMEYGQSIIRTKNLIQWLLGL